MIAKGYASNGARYPPDHRDGLSEPALWILCGCATTYGLWPADMRDERLVLCPGDLAVTILRPTIGA